ncbi:MAG: Fur family transcriptional regulator [Candidatus Limnocylindrales bacterium]
MIDASGRLREAGLRVTRTRLALLSQLDALGGHRSAEELGASFRGRGTPVPRATVYHVLGVLQRAGLVLVADAGPGRVLYESTAAWHHHLVCRSCGSVIDVPCLLGETPCLQPDHPGLRVDQAQVIFRGLCVACTKREGRERRPTGSRAVGGETDRPMGVPVAAPPARSRGGPSRGRLAG